MAIPDTIKSLMPYFYIHTKKTLKSKNMKSIVTLFLFASVSFGAAAQTTITNGGFETWGNPSPGVAAEPTNWFSNKSGSSTAMLGPQTCFQDASIKHSGSYSVRVETLSGPLST